MHLFWAILNSNHRLADVRQARDARHLFGGAKGRTEAKLLLWSTINSKLLLYPLDLLRILPKTAFSLPQSEAMRAREESQAAPSCYF
ncbi:hypothetical protein FQN60_003527 [Etheostoma spectabile]|uniref:Uncharacterized protein n=1 Tax=Etheostoma spectabile TaxID=54343 RepID=A0A5J5CVH3_9PERO|nr:hypothetical protein FQN60_003527 [Etheostoma spectabile]